MTEYKVHDKNALKQYQSLPIEQKIVIAENRIRQFYERLDGKVYVSFSGGKDSTVLLDIVRKMYPNVKAMFVDTGLEYPEIRDFVKTFENVDWVKPEKNFRKVISEYGYPVISKETSKVIYEAKKGYKHAVEKINGTHLCNGNKSIYNCEKWKFMLDAPFNVSHKCCYYLKKTPAYKYEKKTGLHRITGMQASESRLREQKWIQHGCNSFDGNIVSNPLSVWTENDILAYIYKNNLKIASIYGNVERKNGQLDFFGNEYWDYYTTGVKRTGCIFCCFGAHLDESPNRFVKLKKSHPGLYSYCMKPFEEGGLGIGKVLDYLGIEK